MIIKDLTEKYIIQGGKLIKQGLENVGFNQYLPEELGKTITERKWLPEPIKKVVDKLSLEKSPTQAMKSYLATGNKEDLKTSIYGMGDFTGGLKNVGRIAETAGKVTKELEPLVQEARKYKSAEEFVNSQVNEVRSSLIKDIQEAKDIHLNKIKSGELITTRGGVKAQFGVLDQKNIVLDALKGNTTKIGEAQRILSRWIIRHEKTPIIDRGINIASKGERSVWDNKWINTYEDAQKLLSGKTDFKRLGIGGKSQLTDIYNQAVKFGAGIILSEENKQEK